MEIISNMDERKLIELSLNYYNSGYDYKLPLLFHALAHSWKVDKLIYYINVIEGESK